MELYCSFLLLLAPLTGFILLMLGSRKGYSSYPGLLSTSLMGVSVASVVCFATHFLSDPVHGGLLWSFTWLSFTDTLAATIGFEVSALTVMMLVVVTIVSFVVHLYSISYIKGDSRVYRYFAFLQLFTFSMTGLVAATNLIQVYLFWELVGVSSFLLIGYYITKPSAIAAAKKAFIVTRFADFALLIGILLLGNQAATFEIDLLLSRLLDPAILATLSVQTVFGISTIAFSLLLIFIGCAGKSAVLPFHVWLPDAMEGPTPVSALIHAATMVVAGVFLLARLFFAYAFAAPHLLQFIAVIALISSLFSAIMASFQIDLKRTLAYSTISQISLMILALGVGSLHGEQAVGYSGGLFHLFTHAFSKAALFLCAGVVIHALSTGDIQQMGGLRKRLPITHIVFLIGVCSLAGLPPFSGYFSKEAIMHAVHGFSLWAYLIALLVGFFTSFYMFRLYLMVFWGAEKSEPHHGEHPITSTSLVILAIPALCAGFIDFGRIVHPLTDVVDLHPSFVQSILPVTIALFGFFVAWLYTQNYKGLAILWHRIFSSKLIRTRFGFDTVYLFFAKRVMIGGVAKATDWTEQQVVNPLIRESGRAQFELSRRIRIMQSGRIQTYAYFFLGGVILIALLLISRYLL